MKSIEIIGGVKFILETEHPSRTDLNRRLAKIAGTIHIKHTTYGTWQIYRKG